MKIKTRHAFAMAIAILICVHTINIVSAVPPRVSAGKNAGTISGSTTGYYQDQSLTTLTTYYQELDFGFYSMTVVLLNDSTNYIEWSWGGNYTKGKLLASDEITMDFIMMDDVWLRGEKGIQNYRLIIW